MSKGPWLVPVIALALAALPVGWASADPRSAHRPALTMALFGDAPYGTTPTDAADD